VSDFSRSTQISNFRKNPYSGSRVVSMRVDGRKKGRTDRQDEVNNRFSKFCERAKKPHTNSLQTRRWTLIGMQHRRKLEISGWMTSCYYLYRKHSSSSLAT